MHIRLSGSTRMVHFAFCLMHLGLHFVAELALLVIFLVSLANVPCIFRSAIASRQ